MYTLYGSIHEPMESIDYLGEKLVPKNLADIRTTSNICTNSSILLVKWFLSLHRIAKLFDYHIVLEIDKRCYNHMETRKCNRHNNVRRPIHWSGEDYD